MLICYNRPCLECKRFGQNDDVQAPIPLSYTIVQVVFAITNNVYIHAVILSINVKIQQYILIELGRHWLCHDGQCHDINWQLTMTNVLIHYKYKDGYNNIPICACV